MNNNKMNINTQNENGQTRLMMECLKGNYKIVRHLMHCRSDLDIVDHNSENALMYAIRNPNNKRCVQKLASLTMNFDHHNKK